jgi:hypothetical protein
MSSISEGTGGAVNALTLTPSFGTWSPPNPTSGVDTFFVSGKVFVASVFLPVNKKITGIEYLIGSVGGTNKIVGQLNSAAGALLANSTLTGEGTECGTAAQSQKLAFTTPYEASGPATYFIGLSGNGGTAKLRTVPSFTAGELLSQELSQTVAVPATIVAPTSFHGSTGPIAWLY